jgi:lysophospholipase L1-like esterase
MTGAILAGLAGIWVQDSRTLTAVVWGVGVAGGLLSRRSKAVHVLVANLVVLAAVGGLAEGGVRAAGVLLQDRDVPMPYRGATYYDEAFASERTRFVAFTGSEGRWAERDEGRGRYRVNGAHDGVLISIVDGVRTTSGQPTNWRRTVWLLGGSTTLCGEVPDEWTIASLLQDRIGGADGVRVVNLGVNAASVRGNLAQLRGQVRLADGDVVVMYGGINNVRGIMDEGARWQAAHEVLTSRYVDPWRRRSIILRTLDDVVNAPLISYSAADMWAGLAEMEADLRDARSIATSAGARLLFVLQPNLFTKKTRSPYEADLAGRWEGTFRDAVRHNYEAFEALVADNPEWSVDLTSVLDASRDSPYFDWMHVSHLGNQPVAEAIHAELERRGWLSDE